MNLYLDDNADDVTLAALLRKAQHHVTRPVDAGLVSASDALHMIFAVRQGLALMTKDAEDFENIHNLIQLTGGSHPGIILLRYDNNTGKDMRSKDIIIALGKLERASFDVTNQLVVLNQWR
jgi:predicted nuclease of predicted toxin-antitoxin system